MSIAYLTSPVLDVTELVKCFLNLPLLASVDLLFSSVFVLSWAAQCGGTIRMVDEILPSLSTHHNITTTTQQHYNNSNITTTTATTLQQHGSSGHHPDTIVLCCIVHVENNSNMTTRCKVHETSRCWLGAISIILSPIFSCEVNNFSLFPFGPLVPKLSAPVGELALITWKHYHN